MAGTGGKGASTPIQSQQNSPEGHLSSLRHRRTRNCDIEACMCPFGTEINELRFSPNPTKPMKVKQPARHCP